MSKDERDIFEKYIRPQLGALRRLKFKIWALTRSKRIRTIRDINMDYDFLIRLMCIMFLIACVRLLITYFYEVYVWFYPPTIVEERVYPYFIPVIKRITRGGVNV